ncbi:MAG TPA: hypothetical protein DCR93_08855 [Cytophagales bacterium]|nr:hypothetical protein [Cytophagales bacterium]HAP59595.1 hypothetical protein [Cytophagales bacterium]
MFNHHYYIMRRIASPIQLLIAGLLMANLLVFCSNTSQEGSADKCLAVGNEMPTFVPIAEYIANTSRYKTEIADVETRKLVSMNSLWNDQGPKAASQHITFTMAELKGFIYNVEQRYLQTYNTLPQNLSITWSYALYGRDAHYPSGHAEYKSLQTLYGMPSILTAKGPSLLYITDSAIFQEDEVDDVNEAQSAFFSFRSTDADSTSGLDKVGGKDVYAITYDPFNRGGLCPPCSDEMKPIQKAIASKGEEHPEGTN